MKPKSGLSATDSGTGRVSGIFTLYDLGASVLVNATLDLNFEYRILYRLTSLALRSGGVLEASNEDIAIFGFPDGGIRPFMDTLLLEMPVAKTFFSPKERGISKVNIRFKMR